MASRVQQDISFSQLCNPCEQGSRWEHEAVNGQFEFQVESCNEVDCDMQKEASNFHCEM